MKTEHRLEVDWTEPNPFDGAVTVTREVVEAKKERRRKLLDLLKQAAGQEIPPPEPKTRQLCLL